MLLAYHIAAINIENTYTTIANPTNDTYTPFEGIVLTDTFTLTNHTHYRQKLFAQNNQGADHQQQLDIRVIVGNPPYPAGQTSQNDANQNLKYPAVDQAIENTYAKQSLATNKNSLYDSYLRAFRGQATASQVPQTVESSGSCQTGVAREQHWRRGTSQLRRRVPPHLRIQPTRQHAFEWGKSQT